MDKLYTSILTLFFIMIITFINTYIVNLLSLNISVYIVAIITGFQSGFIAMYAYPKIKHYLTKKNLGVWNERKNRSNKRSW